MRAVANSRSRIESLNWLPLPQLSPTNAIQSLQMLSAAVEVATDNTLQSLVCATTSTGSVTRRTDRVVQKHTLAPSSRRPQIECRRGRDYCHYSYTKTVLAMTGIKVIDTRRTPCGFYQSRTREGCSRQFSAGDASDPVSSARLQFGWRLVVKFGFGGGLCAPEQGDGNLIHYRREREHTNRPRPHHRSVQFLGSQAETVHRTLVNLIDTATDSLRL
jgi:hypothetical protein